MQLKQGVMEESIVCSKLSLASHVAANTRDDTCTSSIQSSSIPPIVGARQTDYTASAREIQLP
jgi:hypothetical protein